MAANIKTAIAVGDAVLTYVESARRNFLLELGFKKSECP